MDESRGPLNVGEEPECAPLTEPSRQPLTAPDATTDIQQMLAEIGRGRGR